MWDWLNDLFSGSEYYPTDYGYTPESSYTLPSVPDTYDSYDFMGGTPATLTPEPVATPYPVIDTPPTISYTEPTRTVSLEELLGTTPTVPTTSYNDLGTGVSIVPSTSFADSFAPVVPTTAYVPSQSQDYGLNSEPTWADIVSQPPVNTAEGERIPHYSETRPVIDAGPSSEQVQPSIVDRITKSLGGVEDFLTKNRNLVSLGVGGLQGLMAYQQQKKAAEQRKKQEEALAARQAKLTAQSERFNQPINYGAYRSANARQALNPGISDYRAPSTRDQRLWFTQPTNRISGQIEREATRAAKGGSIKGGLGAMRSAPTRQNYLAGTTGGQADKIPALLSDGEFVMDADTVAALGDGNNAAGARKLDQMRQNIRAHKRSAPTTKIPPKAKAPEAYLKGGKV